MANEVLSTTTASDQEKFLAAKLIARAYLKLIAVSMCDKVQQPEGTGVTANFVRYNRMNVPMATISEGVDPVNNSVSVTNFQVTLDQWGDVVTLTDVSQLTTKHPLLQQVNELLADNAQRVIDREVQVVWMANSNVIFGDASVSSRGAITSGMKVSDALIHRARVTLETNGSPARGGPSGGYTVEGEEAGTRLNQGMAYAAVAQPTVIADIETASTTIGSWASVAVYANQKAIYNAEVGTWLGIRWVSSNFMHRFQLLGNSTIAVGSGSAFGTDTPTVTVSNTGGALANGAYNFVVTKKDLTRGFEEFISILHTTAAVAGGGVGSIAFNFSSLSAGFVWNLYFDNTAGGSGGSALTSMQLVAANVPLGTTVTITSVATAGANPPAAPPSGFFIYPIHFFAEEACKWVGLQNLEVMLTKDEATTDNPLKLRRKLGYKFMGKTIVPDVQRVLRCEVAASISI